MIEPREKLDLSSLNLVKFYDFLNSVINEDISSLKVCLNESKYLDIGRVGNIVSTSARTPEIDLQVEHTRWVLLRE